jgi:acyl-coenzyme A synthetase/AMP-(fatty) acid ligase
MYNGRRSSCPPREVADDRVQVQLPNWNEFVVVYVALARIGAVLVPTMPIYRLPEMLQVVDALPTTMTGKVQKFLLREAAQALAHQM